MRIIFCADPFQPSVPDSAYAAEAAAAEQAGFTVALIRYEALVEQQDELRATWRVVPGEQELAIYRGWMLRPEAYERLYHVLSEKGVVLINDLAAYRHCHYLPECYPLIESHTPRSTWLNLTSTLDLDEIMCLLVPFGDRPVLLKDFVKSRKHEWFEACYIPRASDRVDVERITQRFLELQGEELNEGLVFREFVEFEPLTIHTKSGMPLIKEYRLFFCEGQLISATPYWDEGDYGNDALPLPLFCSIAQSVHSRFFTLDIARRHDGQWMIIEPGDGQVAGLPAKLEVVEFYRRLYSTVSSNA
ncbi:ATP-grasp domain-containing protein [Reticulibacter mediterranei]|nr:ATP-grasp domain-containing protein [Reticulibacter mediterranei]